MIRKHIGFVVALLTLLVLALSLLFWVETSTDPARPAAFSAADHLVNGDRYEGVGEVSALGLKKGGNVGVTNIYGWNWDHTVTVFDGTNNPVWDVPGAAKKWSIAGLTVVMTTDEASADIVVTQGDANAMCGTSDPIIGCGDTTVDSTGEPTKGRIIMSSNYATWPYTATLVGGTVHEMGHTVGFGHAPVPNSQSVMGVPIPANCGGGCARTTLSSYDGKAMRQLY